MGAFDDLIQFSDDMGGSGSDGIVSVEEMSDLAKAMQVGYGTDAASFSGTRALTLESLEDTLKLLTYGDQQMQSTLFSFLYKKAKKAASTVEEYTTIDSWGEAGTFMGEMTDPQEEDIDLTRHTAQVKYQRTKVKISDVALLTKKQADIQGLAALGGARRLGIATERALWDGDSSIIPTEFDGLKRTIAASGDAEQTIDLAGAQLDEDYLIQGAHIMAERFGTPSHMFTPLAVLKSLNQNLESGSGRYQFPLTGSGEIWFGRKPMGLHTEFGDIRFQADWFPGFNADPPAAADNTDCPSQPTIAITAVSDATSLLAADTYYYTVVAENQYGRSARSAENSQAIAAGEKARIAITTGGGTVSAYRVYRSTTTGTTKYIGRAKYSASPQNYDDLNASRHDCYSAVMVDLESAADLETMAWKQFLPMSRKRLAPIGSFIHWLQYLYGTVIYYAPKRIIHFKNIGV